MVTVAKGLDAPIKLLFPRLAAAATVSAAAAAPAASVPAAAAAPAAAAVAKAAVTNFAGEQLEFSMLGLGDIVIPGFFLALLLRFDAERGSAVATHGAHGVFAKPYFSSGMAAYVAGLATTVQRTPPHNNLLSLLACPVFFPPPTPLHPLALPSFLPPSSRPPAFLCNSPARSARCVHKGVNEDA